MSPTTVEATGTPASARPAGLKREAVVIPIGGISLPAELVVPPGANGLVLFMLATGSIRETPQARALARAIEAAGIGTLTFSLLTSVEAGKDSHVGYWSFDLELLTHRLRQATEWVTQRPQTRDMGIGYMGPSTLAAAALVAAAQLGDVVQAVVARSGRPDFAGDTLPVVTASTLLIVGERDQGLVEINLRALARLVCPKRMAVVPGAGHLFDEPGAIEQVGAMAAAWFGEHLRPIKRP